MNKYFLILVLVLVVASCKEKPLLAIHLAAANDGTYSEEEYQRAVEAVKSRLYTQDIDFESVSYDPEEAEIVVLLPANAASSDQIEALTAHVEIGFWAVRPRTASEVLEILGMLSAEERSVWPWSGVSFIEGESDPRNDVLALSRDASVLDTVAALLNERLPADRTARWRAEASLYYLGPEPYYQLYVLESAENQRAPVNQVNIQSAEMVIDEFTAQVLLEIAFDKEGTTMWEKMTERAANADECVAITVGDRVLSAPRVREPIREGRSVITGAFSVFEADEMAQTLNAGSLPMPLTVIRVKERKE